MSQPGWMIGAAMASPILAGIGWAIWEAHIRPTLVSRIEIDRLAKEYVIRHGQRAEEMAHIDEDRAWRYSEATEQGKLRRVRKRIRELNQVSALPRA